MAHQNSEAMSWVRAVFDALRLAYGADSTKGRQECGSLAAMYNETLEARLPATLQAKVLLHDLGDAVTIGLKRPGQIRKSKGRPCGTCTSSGWRRPRRGLVRAARRR